ncbi:hypothetical protein ACIBCC_29970 [Streptomyces griseus]|uniref:hypothetical protein n=1 Tax=Streptomyces griseus TaxID=1911 RepID=UPI003798A7D3
MLPPNLTRHYWETRRNGEGAIRTGGLPNVPWFQLSLDQRAALEAQMDIFREAIRAAEREQDLVAGFNARTAAPEDSASAEEPSSVPMPARSYPVAGEVRMYVSTGRTAPIRYEVVMGPLPDRATLDEAPLQEDCVCLGCSAVAAFLKLTTAGAESVVPAWRPPTGEFAARNAALIDQIARARSNGHRPGAEHALRPESESAADEGAAGPDQPSAAPKPKPKPMTVTEALAKQLPGTIGSGPVQLAFGTPLLSSDKLSQEVWKIVVDEIRRENLRKTLLRGIVSLA